MWELCDDTCTTCTLKFIFWELHVQNYLLIKGNLKIIIINRTKVSMKWHPDDRLWLNKKKELKHISFPSVNELAKVLIARSIQTLETTISNWIYGIIVRLKLPTGRSRTLKLNIRLTVCKTDRGVKLGTSVEHHQLVVRRGFEPVPFGFQVQRTYRSATLSTQRLLDPESTTITSRPTCISRRENTILI